MFWLWESLLWLDASDQATLTVSPDGHVSAWTNKAAKVGRKLTSSGTQLPLYVAKALGEDKKLVDKAIGELGNEGKLEYLYLDGSYVKLKE